MIAFLAIVLAVAATIGQAKKESLTMNCPAKAITVASEYLINHNETFSSVECFQELIGCVKFDVQKPLAHCAKELGMPKLLDGEWTVAFLQNYRNDYLNVLRATCCVKTHEALLNLLSFETIHERIEKCAAASKCGK